MTRPLRLCCEKDEMGDKGCIGFRKEDAPYRYIYHSRGPLGTLYLMRVHRWFARLLLDGTVIAELKRFKAAWKDPPAHITQMKPSKRVQLPSLTYL
jgi:hypothetical protein